MAEEQKKLQWAVALFERGIAEDRVEAALEKCDSLQEAYVWLGLEQPSANTIAVTPIAVATKDVNGRQGKRPRESEAVTRTVSAAATPFVPQRRASGKRSREALSGLQPALTVTTVPEPAPAPEPQSPPDPRAARFKQVVARSEALAIDAQDGRVFWHAAAARWSELQPGLQKAASGNLSRSKEALSPRPVTTPQRMPDSSLEPKPAASPALNGAQITCELCCCDTPPWQAVRLVCQHGWYCRDCVEKHAKQRLERGEFDVTCPQCEVGGKAVPLPEKDLRRLLPLEMLDMMEQRSLERAVCATSDLFFCPAPDCAYPVALEEDDGPRFECPQCEQTCCMKCGAKPWHKGMTCAAYQKRRVAKDAEAQNEAAFERWATETGCQRCPGCDCMVSKEKLEKQNTQQRECHKMICRNCSTKFCFKCGLDLTTGSCNCSSDKHGFIDPYTKEYVAHRKPRGARPKPAA